MSLTCISCKLLEHIILSNISTILEEFLCQEQHEYQKGFFCTTQLVTTCNEIMEVVDKEISVLELSKAFDKVTRSFFDKQAVVQ